MLLTCPLLSVSPRSLSLGIPKHTGESTHCPVHVGRQGMIQEKEGSGFALKNVQFRAPGGSVG